MADRYSDQVAAELIRQIKNESAPFLKPWKPGEKPPRPVNAITGKEYNGSNFFHLSLLQPNNDPRWCTYKQAKSVDAQVRKGEKGTMLRYFVFEEGDVELERPKVRHFNVFHASQIDGLEPWLAPEPVIQNWNPIDKAQEILERSKAQIFFDQHDRAFYRSDSDEIHLPPLNQFPDAPSYYSVALHELAHWTGHESRLDRDMGCRFGSDKYAAEELRAELATFTFNTELGIGFDPGQHRAYLKSWIKQLENDPRLVLQVMRDADQIVDFLETLSQEQEHSLVEEQEVDVPNSSTPNISDKRKWLYVPYKEKDIASAAGARWHKKARRWFAPPGTDLTKLTKWLDRPQTQDKALDPVTEFAGFLTDAGLVIEGQPIMDGELHRVPVTDSKPRATDGAYVGHLDNLPAGWVKNYKTGHEANWVASGQKLSRKQSAELRIEAEAKRQERKAAREREYLQTAERLQSEWSQLEPVSEHPYLEAKGVPPGVDLGVKVDDRGALVVPLIDESGEICSVQRIGEDGFKRMEKGGRAAGCWHIIGGEPKDTVFITTGFGTGAAVHAAIREPIVCAMSDGHLKDVALTMRKRYPDHQIVILGDDDRRLESRGLENSGAKAAKSASRASNAHVILPILTEKEVSEGFTDFADIAKRQGIGSVKKQIVNALASLDHSRELERAFTR